MKRRQYTPILLAIVALVTVATAQETKHLEAWAAVTPDQAIRIQDFTGTELIVRTWDEQKAMVKLNISVEMSNEEEQKEFMQGIRIEQDQSRGMVSFRLHQPDVESGFSLKDLFHLRFSKYVKKEIRGEVFLPKTNPLYVDAKYGKLDMEGLEGAVEVESRSSLIDIRSCGHLETIQNNYGTSTIEKCGGNLTIDNRSGKSEVKTFDGSLRINAQYSTVMAKDVTAAVNVESQSGSVTLTGIGADVLVNAPYSNIVVEKVKGFASVTGKSGSVKISNVIGLEVDAPYSTIDAEDVKQAQGRAVIIRGRSGKITLAGIGSAVDIQSPYTNIDLTEIDGDVQLNTNSSTVRASRVRGDWASQTAYAHLTLRDLSTKKILIENKSGSVDVDLSITPESVEIVNQYADVTLSIPKGLNANVRLKSEYGKINSDLPIKIEEMGSGALAIGKTGAGAGEMSVENKSGNIRVRVK